MKTAVQIVCLLAAFGGLWIGGMLVSDLERRRHGIPHGPVQWSMAVFLLFAPAVLAYSVTFWILMRLG